MADLIYDRILTVYRLSQGTSPAQRKLTGGVEHYYREADVYASRYWQAKRAGETISMMAVIPRQDCDDRVTAEMYCIPEDGRIYRIVQAQHTYDANGQPVTVLSLSTPEGKYELLKD